MQKMNIFTIPYKMESEISQTILQGKLIGFNMNLMEKKCTYKLCHSCAP